MAGICHGLAWLRLRSGEQEQTAQVPSFHAVCWPVERIWCRPDLESSNFAIQESLTVDQFSYFGMIMCCCGAFGNFPTTAAQNNHTIGIFFYIHIKTFHGASPIKVFLANSMAQVVQTDINTLHYYLLHTNFSFSAPAHTPPRGHQCLFPKNKR